MDHLITSHMATQIAQLSFDLANAKASHEIANGQIAYFNQVLESDPKLKELFEKAEAKLSEKQEGAQ